MMIYTTVFCRFLLVFASFIFLRKNRSIYVNIFVLVVEYYCQIFSFTGFCFLCMTNWNSILFVS